MSKHDRQGLQGLQDKHGTDAEASVLFFHITLQGTETLTRAKRHHR